MQRHAARRHCPPLTLYVKSACMRTHSSCRQGRARYDLPCLPLVRTRSSAVEKFMQGRMAQWKHGRENPLDVHFGRGMLSRHRVHVSIRYPHAPNLDSPQWISPDLHRAPDSERLDRLYTHRTWGFAGRTNCFCADHVGIWKMILHSKEVTGMRLDT